MSSPAKKITLPNVLPDHVTDYADEHSSPLHPVLEKLLQVTADHPKQYFVSTRSVLRLLQTLIKATGAKRFLDIGVFTGCSALAAALALPPDGQVVGLDVCMEYIDFGKPYWKEAGVDHKIEVRIAPACESLDSLIENGETFDLVFIDADKEGYQEYVQKSLKMLKKNGLIAIDNVLFHGQVQDPKYNGPMPAALRILNDNIYKDNTVFTSMLTVGDGLTLVLKK